MGKTDKAKMYEEVDGVKRIVIDPSFSKEEYAALAKSEPDVLEALIASLCGDGRRVRQFSATIIAQVAREDASLLQPSIDSLCDALHRPEAQTRWSVLEALYELVPTCFEKCSEAVAGAEASLFDEDSGLTRLAAFRFLCRLGECDSESAVVVWPLINEAIQCYHGDPEFNDMLDELVKFAGGEAPDEVKAALAQRMSFDASSGKGALQRRAQTIVDACEK